MNSKLGQAAKSTSMKSTSVSKRDAFLAQSQAALLTGPMLVTASRKPSGGKEAVSKRSNQRSHPYYRIQRPVTDEDEQVPEPVKLDKIGFSKVSVNVSKLESKHALTPDSRAELVASTDLKSSTGAKSSTQSTPCPTAQMSVQHPPGSSLFETFKLGNSAPVPPPPTSSLSMFPGRMSQPMFPSLASGPLSTMMSSLLGSTSTATSAASHSSSASYSANVSAASVLAWGGSIFQQLGTQEYVRPAPKFQIHYTLSTSKPSPSVLNPSVLQSTSNQTPNQTPVTVSNQGILNVPEDLLHDVFKPGTSTSSTLTFGLSSMDTSVSPQNDLNLCSMMREGSSTHFLQQDQDQQRANSPIPSIPPEWNVHTSQQKPDGENVDLFGIIHDETVGTSEWLSWGYN